MENVTLLQRISQGEKSAVSEFIDRYGGLVWSLARRFTATEADAEDAVQEIFLDLWKSSHAFRPEIASEQTFTAMVARRRLIDRQRKKRISQSDDVTVDQISSSQAAANIQAEISDEAAKATRLLEALPAEQSQSIKLAVYDGLSHSQIADVTGLSLGTVKTHIRRGLIRLREQIGFESGLKKKGGES